MPIELPPLPYAYDALEPHIGRRTLEIHHDKHHAKYVATTNTMIAGTDLDSGDVVSILRAAKTSGNAGLFNNAAQVWNHTFYWNCMKAGGGGAPTGRMLDLINQSFGSYDNFKKEFETAGNTQFGSGWAWLVHTAGGLKVMKTSNAENPLTEEGMTPILTMDVWEHAYYLDYQNMRPTYVTTFLDSLINWDFVESQLPK
mmetsp:Transcript_26071/g.72900  ORF Transcript_26071/g.72900 Transcript_26071/m.72900 type:complete len:199 (+) Transcript_26071:40-636(+)